MPSRMTTPLRTSSDPPYLTGEERVAWLALTRVRGIGPTRLRRLLEACTTPLGAFSAPISFLCAIPGFDRVLAEAVRAASLEEAARVAAETEALVGRVLLPGDPEFPDLALPLAEAPLCLFARGNLALLERPAVAVVGSRTPTRYGVEVGEVVAGRAAGAGLVVVSGMARGLDAVAHRAALAAGGGTIGVLGCGLGVMYPASNRPLYEEMAARGLLLTEHPPHQRPTEGSFPERNRIIAALARVTVVIEAGATSGALITARVANDLSRTVMAVPGPVTSALSVGTNRLIQDGAHPLLRMEDLLTRYPELSGSSRRPAAPDADLEGEGVLARLQIDGPQDINLLSVSLGTPIHALMSELGTLETLGQVRRRADGRFETAEGSLAAELQGGVAPARP